MRCGDCSRAHWCGGCVGVVWNRPDTRIERAAIATVFPNLRGRTVLLDAGANVDSKPKHLVQAAIMGSIYASLCWESPNLGLGC
jgi:fatty acid/phospholipid biosynthesis enzyme